MRILGLILALLAMPVLAAKTSILNLADVAGERNNQLVGYGLVVGLDGTGDRNQVTFTMQSIDNMLRQFGVQGADSKVKNVAAVAVHASIGSSTSPGQMLDITVSSLGDASSLRGGTLLMTPLYGVDGEVYAFAQGNLVVGGATAQGNNDSSITVNIPTAGRIPNGAIVEKAVPNNFTDSPYVFLNLKKPNFSTARNVEQAINDKMGPGTAMAQSAGTVQVYAPKNPSQRVSFLAMLQSVDVQEGKQRARVVFNSRSGTVVMSEKVYMRPAAVTHGSLTVSISETQTVSQPNALAGGQTTKANNSKVSMAEDRNRMLVWPEGTSLDKIVETINRVGATPTDLMSILQALYEAGSMDAEFIVI